MIDKLEDVERRFERLTADLSNPDVLADSARLQKVSKERAGLEKLVDTFRTYRQVLADLKEVDVWLDAGSADEKSYAREALPGLKEQRDSLESSLKLLLLPKDPNDEKNVILEIRAGAGGDEAALFAEEVMQMYLRYADQRGWKSDIIDMSAGNAGGVKDATVTLSGDAVFSNLKYESGVHRVQRVPATETQGRIHTSTITVAVMPEAEEVDVKLNEADIDRQAMRSTGAGGQSVNTTDSAVRLTHRPTGIVVKCQQEKSQLKNYNMALRMLRAKIYEMEQERIRAERDSTRRSQVGTGDRSEKIRTYNFPQDRLTDHRIGLTVHNLPAVMMGDIEDIITACRTFYQAEALKAQMGGPRPQSEA
ncbi:peptide chain release factor 1 [Myxococcus sp. CA051A]|uniref:Peptide chain release factor 1 n=1 Tax=Myxococcus llanfairpwllgwyngyllgogerychwyrndrobwllllantysiliogogogochensis TaxID=2590453 RepID=A0A540WRS7_9BACT|nr:MULTISPECIES: peptide chain release factor 1 [Myxococcus]NTX01404.1 peptide chain release factor 1 [Myxococcus sp. CA040A]NTX15570.1 peptide chain release factor 1 [Myxococcus sp. CA056]NTX32904.1 peptide chain release factor 1 [Myxococcus sp. CA033]NTX55640.1 peptide chain release factor 1 [Myxococcus sp. CA039A]NTX60030.1 peptide chain release factor 1 [Myxococcus sp. CA051A]